MFRKCMLAAILAAAVSIAIIGCNKENGTSTSPTLDFTLPTSIGGGSTPPNSGGSTEGGSTNTPAKNRYSNTILNNQGVFTVEIKHTDGATLGRVGVACYENPERTTGRNQKFFSTSPVISIASGGRVTVSANIPQCVYFQCDAYEGDPITDRDPFYGNRLIVGRSGMAQGSCSPPPPPPPPPPICEHLDLQLSVTSVLGANAVTAKATFSAQGGDTFKLDWGNGLTVAASVNGMLSHNFPRTAPGIYTVRYIVTKDGQTCDPTDTVTVPPLPPPTCDIEDLEERAKNSCEFGVESTDENACTWECNPPPPPTCDDVEGELKAIKGNETDEKITYRFVFNGKELGKVTYDKGDTARSEEECFNVAPTAGYPDLDCERCIEVEIPKKPEDPVCEPQIGGPFPKQGSPSAECNYFGMVPGPPGIYVCKAGTEMFSSYSPFTELTCVLDGKNKSHETTCACPSSD